VAGAAAAATVVAGAHLIPAAKSLTTSSSTKASSVSRAENRNEQPAVALGSVKGEQMIVMMDGDALEIFQGENRFQVRDASFTRFFSSALKGKIMEE